MALSKTFKFVAAHKPKTVDPVVARRQRLIRAIRRQVALLREYEKGKTPGGTWFWTNEAGEIYVSVRYGRSVLELAKDKNAIQCKDLADVERTLDVLEQAALEGEFDPALAKASQDIRAHFGK